MALCWGPGHRAGDREIGYEDPPQKEVLIERMPAERVTSGSTHTLESRTMTSNGGFMPGTGQDHGLRWPHDNLQR